MTKLQIREKIENAVKSAREKKPLAPSITNAVTVNFVANAQIAAGGSAAMVYLPDEGEQIAKIGSAVYMNAGTLFPFYEDSFPRCAKACRENGTPWVLDPVGIGIGSLRTKLLRKFKDFPPSIVRGNASEIIALSRLWNVFDDDSIISAGPSGVDSVDSVEKAVFAAKALARFINGAVCVSGGRDFVTDGENSVYSFGGSHFMEKITGAGCSLGGVCAVYAGVSDPFTAALSASQIYNLAGTRAEKYSKGPGSFQMNFLDELYLASAEDVAGNSFEIV